jgi:hypothetical protein
MLYLSSVFDGEFHHDITADGFFSYPVCYNALAVIMRSAKEDILEFNLNASTRVRRSQTSGILIAAVSSTWALAVKDAQAAEEEEDATPDQAEPQHPVLMALLHIVARVG